MCFIYLAFDLALEEVVWYCMIRQVGGPGAPGTPDSIWNLKTSLSTDWCNHIDCHHAKRCLEQLLTQHRLPRQLTGQCSQENSFLILQTSPCLPAPLILAVSEYDHFLYDKSKAYETCLAKTDNLKQWIQECIQGIHKDMLQYVMK